MPLQAREWPKTVVTEQTPTERELAGIIVEVLNLPDITPDALKPEEPLFGGGTLALDSIDALEIAVAVAQRYGVQLRAEDEATKQVFANIRSLARHIDAHRAAPTGA
jgi:acyl carrier protein